MASPPESLVSYETPVSVGGQGSAAPPPAPSGNGATAIPSSHVDEILNSILPPRTWDQSDATSWMQYTSKAPASRLDVVGLQEMLDKRLIDRQARESGICPVREDLYEQCFDELIRQVTINCPERGLLLLRVRDEIRMTTDAFKTLFESSITFGVRKQLQSERGMSDMESKVQTLESECKGLEAEVQELRNKVETIEKRESEVRDLNEKRRKTEIDFLKYQGQHLDNFYKSVGGGA